MILEELARDGMDAKGVRGSRPHAVSASAF
jgi:hypothetical protein